MPARDSLIEAGISPREAEVLELVAQHATNAEIAAKLFVSVRTVESHVSSLLRKLGAADRRELARLARRAAGSVAGTSGADGGAGADGTGPGGPVVPQRVLPVPLTSFVGRAAEVAELGAAVESHRLVTATGPGGVGKTRLAAAVAAAQADRWPDGVWFVDLVPVTDEAQLAATIAATLGITDPRRRSIEDALVAHLAGRRALLVLDNCEHLVAAVAVLVERLLAAAPDLHVLATTQARLMLPFEWVFAVPPLSLPDEHGEGDAVALFVERARQAGAPEPTPEERRRIGEICRRLEGSALAIELAAARLPALGLDGIEAGLSERLTLLAGGPRADARHRSLRSAIDWSYNLLGPADQALLRRVAVFASAFTVDDGVAVAGFEPVDPGAVAAGLARLVEHSLLVVVPGPVTRYRALDSIRQHGVEKMAATPAPEAGADGASPGDELDLVRRRHLDRFRRLTADLAERGALTLGEVLAGDDPLAGWRQAFDAVADDARAALKWASGRPGHRGDAARLARTLAAACLVRGWLVECQRHYEAAADLAGDAREQVDALLLAAGAATGRQVGADALALWRRAADVALGDGDTDTAVRALSQAVELILRGPGIISPKPAKDSHLPLAEEARRLPVHNPATAAARRVALLFELDEASPEAADEARRAIRVAREVGDPVLESSALDALCAVSLAIGDVATALDAVRRRLDLLAGFPPSATNAFEIADAYGMAAEVALTAGDLAAARRYADDLERLPFHLEEGHLATSRRLEVDAMAGEIARVLDAAARFREGWERAGRPQATSLGKGAYAVSMVQGLRGDDEAMAEWREVAFALGLDLNWADGCSTGYAPTHDAILALHRGDPEQAYHRLRTDPDDFRTWFTGQWRPWYAALHAESAVLVGAPDAADRIARARRHAGPNRIAAAMVERAAALAAGDRDRLVAIAADLAPTGCRYQWARTLVLAGGEHAERGRREMAALGAAPMAETPLP